MSKISKNVIDKFIDIVKIKSNNYKYGLCLDNYTIILRQNIDKLVIEFYLAKSNNIIPLPLISIDITNITQSDIETIQWNKYLEQNAICLLNKINGNIFCSCDEYEKISKYHANDIPLNFDLENILNSENTESSISIDTISSISTFTSFDSCKTPISNNSSESTSSDCIFLKDESFSPTDNDTKL